MNVSSQADVHGMFISSLGASVTTSRGVEGRGISTFPKVPKRAAPNCDEALSILREKTAGIAD